MNDTDLLLCNCFPEALHKSRYLARAYQGSLSLNIVDYNTVM